MSHRIKSRIQNSKVYQPNWLSLAQNNDSSHQKMWNQKTQQAKHIQQQKQIDRILFGIVKQRMFGNLLSQDTRISVQGYYALDRINKQLTNPLKKLQSRKISPLKSQPLYQLGTRSRIRHRTIDTGSKTFSLNRTRNRNMNDHQHSQSQNQQIQQIPNGHRKFVKAALQMTKTKKFYAPKQIVTSKLHNLSNYFREIVNNQNGMIFDLKLTKEHLIKFSKTKMKISQRCLEKFLFFFGFNSPMSFKQYCAWIENISSCSMSQSSFFVFQVLDQSRNGFLTISDLFRALQDFPSSPSLQKQLYQLLQKIQKSSQSSPSPSPSVSQADPPTTEQLIITNHNLKLEQMRQLVKQSSKQLISTSVLKSTTYHNSMYALQHNAHVRQKNLQLEQSGKGTGHRLRRDHGQAQGKGDGNGDREKGVGDGMRFKDFQKMFEYRRSWVFLEGIAFFVGEYVDQGKSEILGSMSRQKEL